MSFIKTEYYANEDLTDLVLKVTGWNNVRDQMGFAQERKNYFTRTWIKKKMKKSILTQKLQRSTIELEHLSPIEEGIRRRGNIVKRTSNAYSWNDDSNNSSIRK